MCSVYIYMKSAVSYFKSTFIYHILTILKTPLKSEGLFKCINHLFYYRLTFIFIQIKLHSSLVLVVM